MRTVTTRVDRDTHAAIRGLAQKEGVSMRAMTARIVEWLRECVTEEARGKIGTR